MEELIELSRSGWVRGRERVGSRQHTHPSKIAKDGAPLGVELQKGGQPPRNLLEWATRPTKHCRERFLA